MTAASKSSTRTTKALASAFACLLVTACSSSGPPKPDALRTQTAMEAVENLAKYGDWLRNRSGAELDEERARLEALPESSERTVRLMLLHAIQPDPEIFAAKEALQKRSEELGLQLANETQQRQTLDAELQTTRQQLEMERTERDKLEKKLKALKSLETRIQDRDEANSN